LHSDRLNQTRTKTISLIVSLIIVSFLFVCPVSASEGKGAAKQAEKQDALEYIATVSDKVISKTEFQRNVDMIKNGYAEMGFHLEGPQLHEFKKKILNSLIEKELLLLESENKGIVIDPAAIENEIEEIKSSFPDEAGFEEKLNKMGYTLDFVRRDIRASMAIEQLVDSELAGKADVSDEDVKMFYESNMENFITPEQVKARHILVSNEAGGRKKIEKISQDILTGSDFEKLAQEHSACPSGQNGGDLGYFGRGQMVEPFENAAFGLDIGEVSEIVETSFGYHIIKVEDRRSEQTISFEEVKDSIEQKIRRQKAAGRMPEYLESLKKKYPVEIFQADLK
jgi:parvulin-like peptidyl-prolyl isomerase